MHKFLFYLFLYTLPASASVWQFPAGAVEDLEGLQREELFAKWRPRPLAGDESPSPPGVYVRYQHETLIYFFGPFADAVAARTAEQRLLRLRQRLIAADPKFESAVVEVVRSTDTPPPSGTGQEAPDPGMDTQAAGGTDETETASGEQGEAGDAADASDASDAADADVPDTGPAEEDGEGAPQNGHNSAPEEDEAGASPDETGTDAPVDSMDAEETEPVETDPAETPPQEPEEPEPARDPTPETTPTPTPVPTPTPAEPTPGPTPTPFPEPEENSTPLLQDETSDEPDAALLRTPAFFLISGTLIAWVFWLQKRMSANGGA